MTTRIDEIRNRLNAATPGQMHTCALEFTGIGCAACNASDQVDAHARADVNWLLDEVKRLRAGIEAHRDAASACAFATPQDEGLWSLLDEVTP